MTTSQIEVETRVTELAAQALKAFCDDISGTFGVDTECKQQAIAAETVASLQKRFKKLVAVNIVDTEGLLDGTFQFIFDQEGLFTLGGIIAMLPEKRIMANRQNASPGLAESMVDAMGETGNLLVGSVDRIFSEGLEGHNHFSHRLPAFVGKPWDKSGETIGLAGDEQIFFIPYEMTVGSYPAFNCGLIFPKKIFGESSDVAPEQSAMVEKDTPEETEENSQNIQTATKKTNSKQSRNVKKDKSKKSKPKEPTAKKVPVEITDDVKITEKAKAEKTEKVKKSNRKKSNPKEPTAKKASVEITDAGKITEKAKAWKTETDKGDSKQTPAVKNSKGKKTLLRKPDVSPDQEDTAPDPNVANNVAEDTAATPETSEEPAAGKIFEAIRKITQSQAILPGQSAMTKNEIPGVACDLFEILANDIMQNKVTWASPDDSLQQALAKMQQTDAGYIMIGQKGVLEGIVSKSDIKRAMSPYLQPIFAKWRRPLDDASLKIRIKWIMSRPVRTIKPGTSLAAIMEYMSQFRGRCLPVTDEAGNVHGLVTAFDIFKALLKSSSNTRSTGETAQELVESASPAETT